MKKEDLIKKILIETEKLTHTPEEIQQQIKGIINSTEALTPKQLRNKNEEHEKLKRHLLGGGTTSIFEFKKLVSDAKQPYSPLFPNDNDYYPIAFRLIGLPGDPKEYIKDRKVRTFTMDTVYNMFPKDALDQLKKKNPFLKKILRRRYKLFEYLDSDGRLLAERLRDNAIDLGKECTTIYDFSLKFAKKYGTVIQLRLYED